jgi:hypothetical protein
MIGEFSDIFLQASFQAYTLWLVLLPRFRVLL